MAAVFAGALRGARLHCWRTGRQGIVCRRCATAAVGLTFLAVGLFAAQLMRTSRGANGVAAAAVTAACVIRGIGDALGTPSADHLHMTVAWWSWASPIGWGQQTLAYDANTLTPRPRSRP